MAGKKDIYKYGKNTQFQARTNRGIAAGSQCYILLPGKCSINKNRVNIDNLCEEEI